MKKIKKFYKEHRIFTILMSVVIVCLILIITVSVNVFYLGNGSDKYGNRLEGISEHPISEAKQNDYKNNVKNTNKVKNAEIKVTGRIIYITLQFNENVDLDEAKNTAYKSLQTFSEEELSFYDVDITIKKNTSDKVEGFLVSGARNKNGNGLIWNNNRVVVHDDAQDDNSTEKDE